MNKIEDTFIVCPHCKAQYLPNEIFLPKEFLGTQTNITKNNSGEIEYWSGNSMSLEESYTCDYCNNTFNIEANISFKTSLDNQVNFDEDYSTTIYKNRLTLEENQNCIKTDLFKDE